jgi:GNAT superfamily N-acetyltransferase
MIINKRTPRAKDYCKLRISSGMGPKKEESAKVALENSLYIVSLWEEDILIGLGRIIGDGAISYTVTDIMVDKKYQGRGYGLTIMEHIDEYFERNIDEDAYIMLIANKPANKLYEKFNFVNSEPESCGMLRRKKL